MNKRYGMAALLLMPMLGQAGAVPESTNGTFYSQMKTFAKGGHTPTGLSSGQIQQNGRRCGLTSARVSHPGQG